MAFPVVTDGSHPNRYARLTRTVPTLHPPGWDKAAGQITYFQEQSVANLKWVRAQLTSAQLSTYFVGTTLMWQLPRDKRICTGRLKGGRLP